MRTVFCFALLAVLAAGSSCFAASEGFDELSKLANTGASEDALIAFVQRSKVAYDLTVDEIFFLSDLGYSSATIAKIVDHGKDIRAGKVPVLTAVDNSKAAAADTTVTPTADPNASTDTLTPAKALEPQTLAPSATATANDNAAIDAVQNAQAAQVVQPAQNTQAAQDGQVAQAAQSTQTATAVTDADTTAQPLKIEETVSATLTTPTAIVAPPDDGATIAVFYEALQPYGTWVMINGAWYWRPTACVTDPNWRPYCDRGHWVWTDSDWCWQSDYSWGWAPFHYGRWECSPEYGWLWLPDTCWSPAWVTWCGCDGYYGWAPLPWGAIYEPGLGFRFHGKHWGYDYGFGMGCNDYCFVSCDHFCDVSLHLNILPHHRNNTVFDKSKPIGSSVTFAGNRVVVGGPHFDDVQKFRSTPIKQLTLADANIHAGDALHGTAREDRHGGILAFYRPTLKGITNVTPATFAANNNAVLGSSLKHDGGVKLAPVHVLANELQHTQHTNNNTVMNGAQIIQQTAKNVVTETIKKNETVETNHVNQPNNSTINQNKQVYVQPNTNSNSGANSNSAQNYSNSSNSSHSNSYSNDSYRGSSYQNDNSSSRGRR